MIQRGWLKTMLSVEGVKSLPSHHSHKPPPFTPHIPLSETFGPQSYLISFISHDLCNVFLLTAFVLESYFAPSLAHEVNDVPSKVNIGLHIIESNALRGYTRVDTQMCII